ncbi:MAG: hypothetical protein ABW250_22130 [Pyrinomonadaceae bacterium]
MNERQQAHIDFFLERIEYWRGLKRDETTAKILAARDADHAYPLRTEEEGSEVFDYLRKLERGMRRKGRESDAIISPAGFMNPE